MWNTQEQRSNTRLKYQGLTIDIDNGNYVVDGYIENISLNGLKVIQFSNRFIVLKSRSITVTTQYNQNFKFKISPCWTNRTFPGNYQEVGFKIIDPPDSWKSFVQTMFPEHVTEESSIEIHT